MDFVNEGKFEEERKRRQAEWERVRKPEDPVEAPAEVFDNRSLYDRLKEQHEIKKKDFEDSFALKNQVRGIDDDEAKFLSECDAARLQKEREIRLEEKKEIEEIKKATTSNSVPEAIPKINLSLPSHKKENKQAELLSSVVLTKRKSQPTSAASALLKTNVLPKSVTSLSSKDKEVSDESSSSDEEEDNQTASKRQKPDEEESTKKATSSTKSVIVAGILPGIGDYGSGSSSESDSSSDDDDDDDQLNTSEIIGREAESNSAASKLSK